MKTRLSSVWCVVIGSTALAVAAADCGSSSGACGVQPCGGDVVGTWQAKSACANRATLNQEFLAGVASLCADAKLGAVTLRPSGTVTFGADLTYSASLIMGATVNVAVPSSCLSGQSCAILTAVLQSAIGTNGIESATCIGSGSCTCTFNVTSPIEDAAGTYSTSGTMLTLYATSGNSTSGGGDYCVKGSTLHLITVDRTMPMATVDADVTLTKQ